MIEEVEGAEAFTPGQGSNKVSVEMQQYLSKAKCQRYPTIKARLHNPTAHYYLIRCGFPTTLYHGKPMQASWRDLSFFAVSP